MFRSIDIDVIDVIFSKSLAPDAGGKPASPFPHPALAIDAGRIASAEIGSPRV
jgi:hypothetical protein